MMGWGIGRVDNAVILQGWQVGSVSEASCPEDEENNYHNRLCNHPLCRMITAPTPQKHAWMGMLQEGRDNGDKHVIDSGTNR